MCVYTINTTHADKLNCWPRSLARLLTLATFCLLSFVSSTFTCLTFDYSPFFSLSKNPGLLSITLYLIYTTKSFRCWLLIWLYSSTSPSDLSLSLYRIVQTKPFFFFCCSRPFSCERASDYYIALERMSTERIWVVLNVEKKCTRTMHVECGPHTHTHTIGPMYSCEWGKNSVCPVVMLLRQIFFLSVSLFRYLSRILMYISCHARSHGLKPNQVLLWLVIQFSFYHEITAVLAHTSNLPTSFVVSHGDFARTPVDFPSMHCIRMPYVYWVDVVYTPMFACGAYHPTHLLRCDEMVRLGEWKPAKNCMGCACSEEKLRPSSIQRCTNGACILSTSSNALCSFFLSLVQWEW